ncbi:MAG: TM2 domain-containing protein [Campylobacterota bacterium]
MKGKILNFDVNKGIIAGDDGQRYEFVKMDFKSAAEPVAGDEVDFVVQEGAAKEIYVSKAAVVNSEKSKIAAGLLGIFLGGFGIHKFYLGCTTAGVIMIAVWFFGLFLFALPSIIIGIIGFIEGIIYLVKNDNDFKATYVDNQKCWF